MSLNFKLPDRSFRPTVLKSKRSSISGCYSRVEKEVGWIDREMALVPMTENKFLQVDEGIAVAPENLVDVVAVIEQFIDKAAPHRSRY